MVCGKDFGDGGEEMLPWEQRREGIAHSCTMGRQRDLEEHSLTSQAVKELVGDEYCQTCKVL